MYSSFDYVAYMISTLDQGIEIRNIVIKNASRLFPISHGNVKFKLLIFPRDVLFV